MIFCYFLIMKAGKTPKGTRTRNRITDASIALINDKGFQNVTLNDICAAAGVAPGTFYHYFKSTNDIIKEILRIEGEELAEYYRSLADLPAPEKLRKILLFQLAYYEKKGKEVVAEIYKMELLSDSGFSNIDELLPFQKFLGEIIAEGQAAGFFSTVNSPEEDAVLLLSLLAYYSFRWIQDKSGATLKNTGGRHINNIIRQVIIAG